MKKKLIYTVMLLSFSFSSFGQFEEQFLKTHKVDKIKDIRVWYFKSKTQINLVKHHRYRYFTFDKKRNNITNNSFDENNILVWKEMYYYDSLNRVSKTISYNSEYGTDTTQFAYDQNGRAELSKKNVIVGRGTIKTEFDADSNMIQVTSFLNGDITSVDRYKYTKFDNKGNWIEMIMFKDDTLFCTYIRKLTYYTDRRKK